jgi:hypothetical protein
VLLGDVTANVVFAPEEPEADGLPPAPPAPIVNVYEVPGVTE